MAKPTIIELNGKTYDALTGALLEKSNHSASYTATVKPLLVQPHPSAGGSIDGFVRRPGGTRAPKQSAAHHAARAAQQIAPHQPERSKTLMRHAVKSPDIQSKTAHKIQTPFGSGSKLPAAKLNVQPKRSVDVVDPVRSRRAQGVGRSQLIRRFQNGTQAPAQPQFAQPRPAQAHPHPQTSPLRSEQAQIHPRTLPPRAVHTARTAPASHRPSNKDDIFEHALAIANSHETKPPRESALKTARRKARKSRQILAISASIATFLLLAGFVAYQNRVNLQLQLASAKAGFSASLPMYKPNGYSLGNLSYSPGKVALAYHNQQNQAFNLTQEQSNWNSETLLDNFVATSNQPYQGYESNGRTIYVYGSGNATWVNGGIWYQLHGDKNLPNDQLVKIATSM